MLSVLFATCFYYEACYLIQKLIIKKNHFAEASYHFVNINYNFEEKNLGWPILCWLFFLPAQITILPTQPKPRITSKFS